MTDHLHCPYCGQPKNGVAPKDFCSCRFCGFKSAMVDAEFGKLLIVDRRMPFLKKRCQELAQQNPDMKVVVDRRITQDPLKDRDKRLIMAD